MPDINIVLMYCLITYYNNYNVWLWKFQGMKTPNHKFLHFKRKLKALNVLYHLEVYFTCH